MEEYDAYGEELREALLALDAGEIEEGRAALEALVEEYEDPCYLWLEVGRARFRADDAEGAEAALRAFLEALPEDEGGNARLRAYVELSALRDNAGDEEGAIEELQEAMGAFPDDIRTFFMMGRYLRSKGHAQEAADVLESGANLLSEERPDWTYMQELGLAHLEAGNDESAIEWLDRVIAQAVALRRSDAEVDFPPETAIPRARLHEKAGELERAADLYRALTRGSDRENHLTYHREAARVLLELELHDEARRMLTRALALAENDADARTALEAQLAELE
jgi:tetratricopeptide (TPR) repeat protein